MPLYLDVHHKIAGLTGDGVARAHQKDLEVQHKHGVNYIRYCSKWRPAATPATPTRVFQNM